MKFSGLVGFLEDEVEVKTDVWGPSIVERPYFGDILKNSRSFQTVTDQQNDDFKINNRISILADLYFRNNWTSVRYVVWNGIRWKVNSVDVEYPRIILEIGGVYNGEIQKKPEQYVPEDSGE